MNRTKAVATGLLIANSLLIDGLMAAEWQRNAGVSVSTYYSDNICLTDADKKERSAVTLTPTLQLTGTGDRANLSLNAAVTYDSLADSSLQCDTGQGQFLTNREAVIPSLRYLGDLELVEDWLTLESDAFIGRNPIDPFAPGFTDRFNGRDNVNITYQYGAGATVQRRVSDSADLRLRYYHNEQHNALNLFGDSSEDRGEFDLGTERGGSRLTTGIAGRYSKVKFEENNFGPAFDNTLSSAEIRAALRLSSSWQINVLVGEEQNDFVSFDNEIEGSYWDVGFRWSPNDRIEVALGTGERFFGRTPRMNIRYRHQRSEVTADYSRSLTLPRNLRAPARDPNDPFEDEFGQLPGNPPVALGQSTFVGNTPIINERLSLRYVFSARRTTFAINAADSRQLLLINASEATFSNLNLSVSRSLSANLSGNLRLGWNEREGQGGLGGQSGNPGFFGLDSESWRAGISLSRQLGINTTITLAYDYRDFDPTTEFTSNAFIQFEENRVTLTAQYQF